ncbi:MAG: hypothetical protein M3Y48_24690 [Actinomycetota bacterium]|nr:hypothetical protein [Actinomycetota bacterium]
MKTYDVHVERGDRYWLVHVPEIDRSTQARTLREVEDMARDLISIMSNVAPDSFEIEVDVAMPEAAAEHLARAEQLRTAAAQAQTDAATALRAAAVALKGSGIPLRDLGRLLGVSFQRAGQLTKGGRNAPPSP